MRLIREYHGRKDHKWSCERFYYKEVFCKSCGFHGAREMYRSEYDDSDTIYPKHYRQVTDASIWKKYDSNETTGELEFDLEHVAKVNTKNKAQETIEAIANVCKNCNHSSPCSRCPYQKLNKQITAFLQAW